MQPIASVEWKAQMQSTDINTQAQTIVRGQSSTVSQTSWLRLSANAPLSLTKWVVRLFFPLWKMRKLLIGVRDLTQTKATHLQRCSLTGHRGTRFGGDGIWHGSRRKSCGVAEGVWSRKHTPGFISQLYPWHVVAMGLREINLSQLNSL